ncbi:MFS transporter [uncultured Reyranella sp.]|uniref:MFS transporter n=1 Tax=uncultured Reyranella sp. TaxID=735512 RepID=UPI0025F80921|nr:MFS transporter [uncultured Reyranella sp.]
MTEPQSVQAYIDQTPSWPDGTPTPSVPMTPMQWRIWVLATAGKFFEGKVVFMTGVALPLIVEEFGLSAAGKGIVSAATLAGIMIGAVALGGLADTYGRRRMFVIEMLVFVVFLAGLTLAPSFGWLVFFLFGVGVALGCDYPTAHLVISESIPSRDRGKLVLAAFAFQAIGALVGTALGFAILTLDPSLDAWRWMYGVVIVPAAFVVFARLFVSDSGQWLMSRGRHADAERELRRLLKRTPQYPKQVHLAELAGSPHRSHHRHGRWSDLFDRKNRRATLLASVPWFLQDLGTYGIGIFTPTILSHTIGHEITKAHNVTAVIARDLQGAKGAALVDTLLIVGILAAVLMSDKVGRIRLQVLGFVGCAVGLAMAALQSHVDEPMRTLLLFGGFMIFNFMTNLGPNSQTYLLAGEVFPTHIRGKGAGFAAAFAKMGAVLTAFTFPVVLAEIGTDVLLTALVFTSLLGALITWWFRIETAGVNLEEIGR